MASFEVPERLKEIKPSGIRVVSEAAARLRAEGRTVFDLTLGRPDYDTPGHIKAAAQEALDKGMVHYSSNWGIPELRQAIAKRVLESGGPFYDWEKEILVTAGATQALALTMLTLIQPGDEVIVPVPTWSNHFGSVLMAGGRPVLVGLRPERAFQVLPDDIRQALTPRTRALVIASPHNPTGAMLNAGDWNAVAGICREHDLWLISDEVYDQIVYDGHRPVVPAALPGMKARTVALNSFSKTYSMTGWRVGWLTYPSAIGKELLKVHQITVTCINTFAQYGAWEALDHGREAVREMVSGFSERRVVLASELDKSPVIKFWNPPGAFYLYCDVGATGMPATQISARLLEEAGVATVPGQAFQQPEGEYLRLSFAGSPEVLKLAGQALVNWLSKFQ